MPPNVSIDAYVVGARKACGHDLMSRQSQESHNDGVDISRQSAGALDVRILFDLQP